MSGRISNVKNRFCNSRQIGAAVMLIAVMTSGLLAQDRSRDRGAPIIFSSPKKDAISTNLHEVNQKESPFKNLESEIRKPFEMFDTGAPKPKFNHVRQTQAPAAPVNDSSLKAILEKSAEEQFLNGGNKGQEDLNDPFKSPDRTMDPLNNNKPKTALDRYYDRLEKEQMGRTNNNSSTDLFGRKKDRTSDEKSALEAKQDERLKGEEQDIYSRVNRQMSNNTPTDNRLSRTGNNPSGNRMIEANPYDPYDRAIKQRETRMENFQKLLGGSGGAQPQNNNNFQKNSSYGNSTPEPTRPSYLAPAPTWSQSKPAGVSAVVPGSSFTKSSGMVGAAGKPAGLQDYSSSAAASISTPIAPIQQTKKKTSSFNPPTRR